MQPGPSGITTIKTKVQADPIGRVITVTDAKLGITRNVYGPFSELRRVELPDGTVRETKQDAYGRGVFDDDPDRGKTLVEWNGFDEAINLNDAAGRHYVFERDNLGRTVKRSEGLNVSTYEYDTAANGIGLPAVITGADGHIEAFTYDTLSRPITTTLELADGRTFEHGQGYDQFGHVDRITYPDAFSVSRHYDSTGTLVEVRNGITRANVWKLDVVNAAGQTMLEAFGNKATTERVYDDENNTLQTIFTMSGARTTQALLLKTR
jgi:YD repeat-containing protein